MVNIIRRQTHSAVSYHNGTCVIGNKGLRKIYPQNTATSSLDLTYYPHTRIAMDFPQDLVYTVLSFLSNDRTTLARCSVVCHDWCQPSSRYLFEELRVLHRSPPSSKSLQPFHEFLQTTPRAANHVRILHLGPDRDTSPLRVYEYSTTLMARILACAPYLHTITTPSWLCYTDSPRSPFEASVLPNPSLKLRNLDLALTFCFNKDPTFLSRFLQFFQDIEELTFYGGQTYYLVDTRQRTHYATPFLPGPVCIPGTRPLPIPSLAIGHVTSPDHLTSIVTFLNSALILRSVRKLSITSSEACKARIFNTLVMRTQNIDHLRVEAHQGMDPRVGMCSGAFSLHLDAPLYS